MTKVIDYVLSIDKFEQHCVVLKGMLKSSRLKYQAETIGDLFQPKTDLFSTRALILVHFKTVRYFSQPIFILFSY